MLIEGMDVTRATKPLGGKAYGHISHLPGSRMGPADRRCCDGQARIATVRARDRHDVVIVQEKLDGSCVAIAKLDGRIVPLMRAGYHASTSPHVQHHHFANWVDRHQDRFSAALPDGWRVCGEWLAQAHGTRYRLPHEPFVAFDLMRGVVRAPFSEFSRLAARAGLMTPSLLHVGGPFGIEAALAAIGDCSRHGAIDPVEGAVWRVEREGKVDFLCKYVRPEKIDGCYLPEVSGGPIVWNWMPDRADTPAIPQSVPDLARSARIT